MALLEHRSNHALEINPPPYITQRLSINGSDWLWAVTAIYCISFLGFFGLSFAARNGERIFHFIFTIVLLVGAICYYAMASDLAWTEVITSNFQALGVTRQIFFAKYINWVVSIPGVVIALGLLSGVSWATIVFNVALAWTWIVSYLCSAYTPTNYKWGFYAFGTVAWVFLAISTLVTGTLSARNINVSRDYTLLAVWANLIWVLYPLAYGLADGGNQIGVTPGFIFFGILDVLLVPLGIAPVVLVLSRRWDYDRLNLHYTRYGRIPVVCGTYSEKAGNVSPANRPLAEEQGA